MKDLKEFLNKIHTTPEHINFNHTMACIEANYHYQATAFSNGIIKNKADQNQGSCKLLAFAQLNDLTVEQTLHCFGDYYRIETLEQPNGDNHGNIRAFMQTAWTGVQFEQFPLTKK